MADNDKASRQLAKKSTTKQPSSVPRVGASPPVRELTDVELAAWRGMLRLSHRIRVVLGANLQQRHNLTMADYDALLVLAESPESSMRMSVLAETILQPRSSVTRIVDSLEKRGLVRRQPAHDDARGYSAQLTPAGRDAYERAHQTHIAGIRELFIDRLDGAQQRQLAAAWASVEPSVLQP